MLDLATKHPSDQEKLLLTSYLIAQERNDDAEAVFSQISKSNIAGEIQFDYISIYLKFMKGPEEYKEIKDVCDKYLNYPFVEWRNLFVNMINYISEYEKRDLIRQQF